MPADHDFTIDDRKNGPAGVPAGPRGFCLADIRGMRSPLVKKTRFFVMPVLLAFLSIAFSGLAMNPGEAAGSAQAKVYDSYLKAVAAKDVKALKTFVLPNIAKEMENDKDVAKKLELLKQRAPKKVQYLRIDEKGDSATLDCESETMTGTVTFERVSGAWRIGLQMWKQKK
jgi:hypothetical protein